MSLIFVLKLRTIYEQYEVENFVGATYFNSEFEICGSHEICNLMLSQPFCLDHV